MLKRAGYYLTNLPQCWVVIAVLFLSEIVLAGVFLLLLTLFGIDLMEHYTLLYVLQMLPAVCFVSLAGRMRSLRPGAEFVRVDAPHFGGFGGKRVVLFFLLLAVCTITMGIAVDPLSDIFQMPESISAIYDAMRDYPLDVFISVAIAAPLAEEFLLRGTFERGLLATSRRKTPHGRAVYAILWSAFFFALIHLNMWQAVPAFLLGTFFGWIYYRSHSIWACVFMHFVNNSTSVLSTELFPDCGSFATLKEIFVELTGSQAAYWFAVVAAAAITVLCIMLINKYLPSAPDSFRPHAGSDAEAFKPAFQCADSGIDI